MSKKLYSLRGGLKKARKRKGLKQEDLAKEMNVTLKTVMNWEQGRVNPDLETLIDLSEVLECDLDYLTGKLEESTHDISFIRKQIGLSEEAIKKLQTLKEWNGGVKALSHLIESDDFGNFITSYYAFLDLLARLKHTNQDYEGLEFVMPEYRQRADGSVIMSNDDAIHHFIQRASAALVMICEKAYERRIKENNITPKHYDYSELLAEIKATEEEIKYLQDEKEYLEKEVLPGIFGDEK